MIKTGLNNERTRVCLCLSGDAVHREEAAESSVSLYDLNFLRGSPLSWTPCGPLQPLCFTLSLSLWPLTSAGMCWLTLRVRLKSSPGLRLEPSSQRLWFVCTLLFSSSLCWYMTLSLYSSCVCFRRLPSPASSSTWWTRPAASTPSHSCPTCCTPAGTSPSDYFYRRLGVILILLSTNYISNNIILLSRLIAELYEHDDIMKTTLTSQQ